MVNNISFNSFYEVYRTDKISVRGRYHHSAVFYNEICQTKGFQISVDLSRSQHQSHDDNYSLYPRRSRFQV